MAFGEKLPKDPIRNYYEAHWGDPPKVAIHVDDPDLPNALVEMGKLREVILKDGTHINFGPGCRLVYCTTGSTRLYAVLTQAAQKALLKAFWDPRGDVFPLKHIAKLAGGRQARHPYPPVMVQPIGAMLDCVYLTYKGSYEPQDEPDGLSEYIHRFGELNEGTGELAEVCLDLHGRMWFAGGAYKVLRGGITG